ncbi:GNAT family N-acetyltransferase [Methyloferula stellata]|uniref:GNAT family N-acetyltransferase n=1 Tax=Methyloferula stellata TaxID=876270 RepID=UPI00036087FE|nr:GNAT family N-acyltransferase [Methyloferula stellata]
MERTDLSTPFGLPRAPDASLESGLAQNTLPNVLERLGPFELRLSSSEKELKKIQGLRFKVFYKEGHAIADRLSAILRRDICPFDSVCDHLYVVDTEAKTRHGSKKAKVVGTYRLLRGDIAARHSGFYSQSEFDLAPIIARHPETRLLELGRSCVHSDYRAKRVIELLWRGLWLYAKHHRIDVMIGCASLPTMDAELASGPLATLQRHASLPADWQVTPLAGREANISSLDDAAQDDRLMLANLPPLLKAYLRAGARFSSGAVLDRQFGTIDVFAVMPMSEIDKRYLAHFGADCGLASGEVA